MAFVFLAEDGTGLAGSNSYASVAYADDYHAGRGHADWASKTTDEKQAALVKATDHIEQAYGERFLGVKGSAVQGLHWPAASAWYTGALLASVPDAVRRACCEYALRALSTSLSPDLGSGGAVSMHSVTADGMTVTKQYAQGASGVSTGSGMPAFPAADSWLSPLLAQPMAVRF